MSNEAMLKQLRASLKGLEEAKKVQGKMVGELISQLPEDKRKAANKLVADAKKGKMDINAMMNFAKGVRGLDREEFEKTVKDGADKVKEKERGMKFPVKEKPVKKKAKASK